MISVEEQTFTTLPEPLPVHYVLLSDKHFDEQMQPATLVGLSHRRAVLEATGPLSPYANILLWLEAEAGDEREIYAKVIRNVEESSKRYIIHFTSLPPGMRARLDRLTRMD